MHDTQRIVLEGDLERRIEAFARSIQCTPAEVVRRAFEEYEANHNGRPEVGAEETAYEAVKRAGLLGCLKGGPPDLSTNPKYMEGFGRD